MSEQKKGLELDNIIFVGRTFEEYVDMFNVTTEEIHKYTILDCPAGACSFTASASQMGGKGTASDIAYFHSIEDLKQKGYQDIEHAMTNLEKVKDNYQWNYFSSIKELENHRIRALEDSVNHMISSPSSYVPAILPKLPFEDRQFDLTLSAHFLFMYADRLDLDFHKQSMLELIRVTKKEIRIYPLVDLKSNRYEHLDEIIEMIHENGWKTAEVEVNYEFQEKANHMLRITKEE